MRVFVLNDLDDHDPLFPEFTLALHLENTRLDHGILAQVKRYVAAGQHLAALAYILGNVSAEQSQELNDGRIHTTPRPITLPPMGGGRALDVG